MSRFDSVQKGYTCSVSKEIGFGHLYHRCDASRSFSAEPAASLSVPPVMVARWEARKGLPVRASGVRLTNPSSRRPRLVTSASVFANHTARRPIMAQSLSLPVRTSAQIIPLPTAALQPVLQKNGPGRRPSSIINLRRWKCDHILSVRAQRVTAQSSLEQARSYMQTCEFLFQEARGQYLVAQQQAASLQSPSVSHSS